MKDDYLKFVFPENVDKDYAVWMGYTLKDLGKLIVIVLALLVLIAIPPYAIWWVIVKVFLSLIVLVIIMAIMTIRPIPSRKNIRFTQHLKTINKFNHRQKLFFIKGKKQ